MRLWVKPLLRALTVPGSRESFLPTALGNVALLGLGTVIGIVTARALGPTARGEYAAVFTWSAFSAIFMSMGSVQAVVTYRGRQQSILPFLGLLVLGAFLGGMTVASGLRFLGNQGWLNTEGVVGAGLVTMGSVASGLAGGWAQRTGRMVGAFQLVRAVPQALVLIAMLALWLAGVTETNAWLLIVGGALGVTGSSSLLHVTRGAWTTAVRVRPPREFVSACAGALPVALGSAVVYRIDMLTLALVASSKSVAYYTIAVSITASVAAIAQSVGMSTFSRLRRLDDHDWDGQILRSVLVTAALSLVLMLPVMVVCQSLIRFVYGAAFLEAVVPSRLLLFAAMPLAIDYLLVHALLMTRDRPWRVVVAQVMIAAGSAILIVPASRAESLESVALVVVVSCTVSAAVMGWLLRRSLKQLSSRVPALGPAGGSVASTTRED